MEIKPVLGSQLNLYQDKIYIPVSFIAIYRALQHSSKTRTRRTQKGVCAIHHHGFPRTQKNFCNIHESLLSRSRFFSSGGGRHLFPERMMPRSGVVKPKQGQGRGVDSGPYGKDSFKIIDAA